MAISMYTHAVGDCPFCNLMTDVIMENEYAFSINDRHPVSRGHSLIIPKKHVTSVFELPSMIITRASTWAVELEQEQAPRLQCLKLHISAGLPELSSSSAWVCETCSSQSRSVLPI